MRSISLGVLASTLFCSVPALSQSIVAGVHSTDDVYADLIPDEVLETTVMMGTPTSTRALDIDMDGILDLKFGAYSYNGSAGSYHQFIVFPLASHATIAMYPDTFPGCCPVGPAPTQVADTISFGTLIDAGFNYGDGDSYFRSDHSAPVFGPNNNTWLDIGEHFLGVRLSYPWDTLYGWVQVNVTSSGGGEKHLAIMDHACNINSHVGIAPLKSDALISLHPNPFTDQLTIATEDLGVIELTLFDLASRPSLRRRFRGTTTIATKHLADGMYVFELRMNGELVQQGKLIKD